MFGYVNQDDLRWTGSVQMNGSGVLHRRTRVVQVCLSCLQVYKESIDGFELVAEEECGGGNLRMMKKPIGVIIQPSRREL